MCVNVQISGAMAPKAKHDEIWDLHKRLRDGSSGDEHALTPSGSVEDLGVNQDPEATRPQTRVTARAEQTQDLVVLTPQSDEGIQNGSDFIQMTPSTEESSTDSRSGDGLETESSAVPQSSPSPLDTLTSQWCVKGMRDLYIEDMQSEASQPTPFMKSPNSSQIDSTR